MHGGPLMMQTSRSLAVLYTLALSAMCALPMPEGRPRPMWGLRAAYLGSSLKYGKQGQPHQTSSWSGDMGAMSLDIGISLVSPGCGGGGGVRKRYIRAWDASNTYGVMNSPITLQAGDTIEYEIVPTSFAGDQHFIDSPSVVNRTVFYMSGPTGVIIFDSLLLSVELNGVSIATNTTAPTLGSINTIKATALGVSAWGTIGANYLLGNVFTGQILSVKFTTAAGATVDNYVLDNDSLVLQYARGESSPSAKYINYFNFVASDIDLYTLNPVTNCWESTTHADVCYL